MSYMSCQGKLYLAKIEHQIRQPLHFLGNVPALTVEMDSEKVEHKESFSGQRTTDFVMTKTKTVNVNATLEDFSRENLALVMSGQTVQSKSKNIVGEILPTVKVGDEVKLNGLKVQDVVIKDSTNTAKTLEKGTHYTVDEKLGKISFIQVDGFKQPLMVDYTANAVQSTTLMSADNDEYYLYFEGVNTVTNESLILELWRMKKQAKGTVPFIHEELGSVELSGSALSDPSKGLDPSLGLFGRVTLMD